METKNYKPILFSTPMVKALLNGTKTQTRRIIKPQPVLGKNDVYQFKFKGVSAGGVSAAKRFCPYGKVGDILWVRESFARTTNVHRLKDWPNRPHTVDLKHDEYTGDILESCTIYKADGNWEWCDGDGIETGRTHWKPSIHMPKSACRIFLEITDVRVEQLQEISSFDCLKEGIRRTNDSGPDCVWDYEHNCYNTMTTPFRSFFTLWESINGIGSWKSNPFVWVVEFKLIDHEQL